MKKANDNLFNKKDSTRSDEVNFFIKDQQERGLTLKKTVFVRCPAPKVSEVEVKKCQA